MPAVRLAFVCSFALLAFASPANAAKGKLLPAPKQLRGFVLRADEKPSLHEHTITFTRTPAFAWRPVAGARKYEFELSTSEVGDDGAVIWSSSSLSAPITDVPISLPWITGNPHSLHARVRGIDSRGRAGRWSRPYGFNMRWPTKPLRMEPEYPGLIRWTPVEGATMYEVWIGRRDLGAATFKTTTNVADMRELYTFHRTMPWASVAWRVRAVRQLYGVIPNGLPAVTYGPWSDVFVKFNPPALPGELLPVGTVSGSVFTRAAAHFATAHELTPGFVWNGDTRHENHYELFRVAVFTDVDCVNRVYSGSVVGSPAWAPRVSKAIKVPFSPDGLTTAANGWPTVDAGAPVMTPNDETLVSAEETLKIDLWNTALPGAGYYWGVIPVVPTPSSGYREVEVSQDACRSSGAVRFGKRSNAPKLGDEAPYISGLSQNGKLLSASRARQPFYGTPIVAWTPVWNAQNYEIQWSKSANPWQRVGSSITPATATVLPVERGIWYYRVRGRNRTFQVKPEMTWSPPAPLRVAGPRFRIVRR
jgi:hypothetical protein